MNPPGLLMVHGFGDTSDTWTALRGGCTRRGLTAATIDLPGFRRAAPLQPGPVLPQLDEAVGGAAVRMRARTGAVVAVGNSLGGTLALRAAAAGQVDAVVALAPASVTLARWLRRLTLSPVTARVGRAPVPARVLQAVFGLGYTRLISGSRDAQARLAGRRFGAGYDRRSTTALVEFGARLLPELDEPFDAASVTCPVLLVWGTRDRLVPLPGARQLAADLPEAELTVLPGVGHCPQAEQPERVVDLLETFVRQLGR